MGVKGGAGLSVMADTDGVGDGSVTSIGALTFLGRPLGRLTGTVDAKGDWGWLGSIGVFPSLGLPTTHLE